MTRTKSPGESQYHHQPASSPPKESTRTSDLYFQNATGPRVNTDILIATSLRTEYPNLHLTIVPSSSADLQAYVSANPDLATLSPIDPPKSRLSWLTYLPPITRLGNQPGALAQDVKFGKFLLEWRGKEFIVFLVEGRDGEGSIPRVRNQYILSASVERMNGLVFEVGRWNSILHEEIWVFDQGFWEKDRELYSSVMRSRWEDVILDEEMKKGVRGDTEHFFDSRKTYEDLNVPWKRGVIFYGPPGNGKTVSIKAMMHTLYQREPAVPTLYVKTLASFGGPEYSVNQIFTRARREAPCYLVFEDLDSIITDQVRSYFLNAVDGISKNDGIFMVGSTNHIERLDPGISKRPSRFDRKWYFPNPNKEERVKYMQFWQGKLKDNKTVEFPDKLCPAIANITNGFSFAYMQEAMVAALLAIARDSGVRAQSRFCLECMQSHDKPANGSSCDQDGKRVFKGLYDFVWTVRQEEEKDDELEKYVLWREVKKQVRILREELEEKKK